MRATDRLRRCFGEAEVPDFTFPDQILHRPGHLFDRHVRVYTVLVVEVDSLDPEPLERALGSLLDVLWPAIQAPLLPVWTEIKAEFGGDHDLLPDGRERFAYQLLVRERSVDLGGVEERDATLDGRPDQGDHLPLVPAGP